MLALTPDQKEAIKETIVYLLANQDNAHDTTVAVLLELLAEAEEHG